MKSLRERRFIMTGKHFSAIALTILMLAAFAIADLEKSRVSVTICGAIDAADWVLEMVRSS
jgi:hypothetical protein